MTTTSDACGDGAEATENALLQFIVLPGPTPAAVLEAFLEERAGRVGIPF